MSDLDEAGIDGDGFAEIYPPTGVDYEALRNFQAYCNAQSRARGFHDEPDELKDLCTDLRMKGQENLANYIEAMYYGNRLMLIAGEVTEAHEEIRSGKPLAQTYYLDQGKVVLPDDPHIREGRGHGVDKPEGVPSELADIFIRLMDLSEELSIDLASIVEEKLKYNATRPFKHGKAF